MKYPKNQSEQTEGGQEEWLVTYADAITLLMAFFVLLLSMSNIDKAKYEQVSEGIAGELLQKEIETPLKAQSSLLAAFVKDIIRIIETKHLDNQISVELRDDGVAINLSSSSFFNSGSAILRQEVIPDLNDMVVVIRSLKIKEYLIDVEGHSDDIPIHTPQFPSNWELSGSRAANVVKHLIHQGIDKDKLKVSAYADTRPKVPNRDGNGKAVSENQAMNRRVVIYIHVDNPFPLFLNRVRKFFDRR